MLPSPAVQVFLQAFQRCRDKGGDTPLHSFEMNCNPCIDLLWYIKKFFNCTFPYGSLLWGSNKVALHRCLERMPLHLPGSTFLLNRLLFLILYSLAAVPFIMLNAEASTFLRSQWTPPTLCRIPFVHCWSLFLYFFFIFPLFHSLSLKVIFLPLCTS